MNCPQCLLNKAAIVKLRNFGAWLLCDCGYKYRVKPKKRASA